MKTFFATITICCLFITTAFAQTSGSLRGTVNGPDGVIPGARIVVKDNKTGREVNVQASEGGSGANPLPFGFLFL